MTDDEEETTPPAWKRHLADQWSRVSDPYPTVRVTDDLVESLDARGREIVEVRPPRTSQGIERSRSFVDEFYHETGFTSSAPVYSFAPVYDGGRITFYLSAPEGRRSDLSDALGSKYSGVDVADVSDPLPVEAETYASGARLTFNADALRSLRTRFTSDPLDEDPQSSTLTKMAGGTDETAMLQATFQSLGPKWFRRGWVGETGNSVADALREGEVVGEASPRTIQADQNKNAASDIQRQDGRSAFTVTLRVLATAPEREQAARRVSDIVNSVTEVKNPATGQKLVPVGLGGWKLRAHIQLMAGRYLSGSHVPEPLRLLRGTQRAFTDEELGDFLVHLPHIDTVDAPVAWSEQAESERIPSDAY